MLGMLIGRIPTVFVALLLVWQAAFAMIPAAAEEKEENRSVLAASSLRTLLNEARIRFHKDTKGKIVLSYGSTGSIVRQALLGRDVGVVLTADQRWTRQLVRQLKLPKTQVRIFTGNSLVFAALKGSNPPPFTEELPNVLGKRLVALADPRQAPLGEYSREAFETLGIWKQLGESRILLPDSVATVTFFLKRGSDFAVLYASDATVYADRLDVLPIPQSLHRPIEYSLVRTESQDSVANRFASWLLGPSGRELLREFGFSPPKIRN